MATTDELRVPPYVAWGTFTNLLDRMHESGVPSRIDKTYLSGMSGASQSQLRVALRSLDLIDEENRTTVQLATLADPAERKAKLHDLLQQHFPTLVELCAQGNATQGELLDALRQNGISGESLRKASTFFLQAATFSGLPLSPHFGPVRSTPPGARKAKKRTTAKGGSTTEKPDPGDSGGAGVDAMRKAYFDLLVEKAKDGDADGDLLNRIEKLIGLESN
jgi:hypothetical protein